MGFLDTVNKIFSVDPVPASSEGGQNPSEGNMRFQQQPAQSAQPPAPAPGSQTPPPAAKEVDPLSIFAKMGDNSTQTDTPPAFTLDPAQLTTVANGQDFIRGVDPELLARANGGDSKAMIEVMQAVSRNAYQTAMAHNAKLTESFVAAREGHSAKGFSSKLRGELTVNELTGTPNFQNPGVKAHLVSLAKAIEKEHPDASPQEIAAMARKAVQDLAQAVNPGTSNQQSDPRVKQPTDWDNFFDS